MDKAGMQFEKVVRDIVDNEEDVLAITNAFKKLRKRREPWSADKIEALGYLIGMTVFPLSIIIIFLLPVLLR